MEDVRCGGEDLLTSRENVKIANLHDVFHDKKINLNKSVPKGKGGEEVKGRINLNKQKLLNIFFIDNSRENT